MVVTKNNVVIFCVLDAEEYQVIKVCAINQFLVSSLVKSIMDTFRNHLESSAKTSVLFIKSG